MSEMTQNRIEQTFARLQAEGRKALIPFITAGDPHPDMTLPLMRTLVAAGADIIELGVPFSDPMADGPTIQRASERALKHGTGLTDVLAMVSQFRASDTTTPVVLMGYANPVEVMGVAAFARAARAAGVDGVLVVDYPPEEADDFAAAMAAQQLCPIFLLAPTSSDERVARVGKIARGYVYYVSLKGVTGAGHLDVSAVAERVPQIRAATGVPVGVGFGIRNAETARQLAGVADAVVVGSRIIETIEQATPETACEQAGALIAELRQGVDSAA